MRISDWISDVCSSDLGEIITNTPLGPNPVANTIAVIEDGVIPIAEITSARAEFLSAFASVDLNLTDQFLVSAEGRRSEERRVGKEGVSTCRARGREYH